MVPGLLPNARDDLMKELLKKPEHKGLLTFLVLVVILLSGSSIYLFRINQVKNSTIKSLRSQLTGSASVGVRGRIKPSKLQFKRVPAFTLTKVDCYLCDGEGTLMLQVSKKEAHTYPCPVCTFKGSNEIKVKTGGEICSDCKGMGKLAWPPTKSTSVKHGARLCTRCQWWGWSRKKA